MKGTEKIIRYDSFEDAVKAAAGYRKLGVACEIRSWELTKDGCLLHIFENAEWWKIWKV